MSKDRLGEALRRALEEPLVGIGILAAVALIAVGAPADAGASAVVDVEATGTERALDQIDPIEALVSARLEARGLVLERIDVAPPAMD